MASNITDPSGRPMHHDTATQRPTSVPFPQQGTWTEDDLARFVDSRIHLNQADAAAKAADQALKNRRKDLYKNIGYGVGGLVVGTGATLGISAMVRRGRARRAAAAANTGR